MAGTRTGLRQLAQGCPRAVESGGSGTGEASPLPSEAGRLALRDREPRLRNGALTTLLRNEPAPAHRRHDRPAVPGSK
jgi:hypothetical protein